jgi:hypothetical protein
MCRLTAIKTCSSWTSGNLWIGPTGYHKTSDWNYHSMLHTNPEERRSRNMFNFSASSHQKNAKWTNIIVFCDITQKTLSRRVNSQDLPGQEIGPASLLIISAVVCVSVCQ